jgi:hypothetical protein
MSEESAWRESFDTFMGKFAHHFVRSESRENAKLYVRGLLSGAARKNSIDKFYITIYVTKLV